MRIGFIGLHHPNLEEIFLKKYLNLGFSKFKISFPQPKSEGLKMLALRFEQQNILCKEYFT